MIRGDLGCEMTVSRLTRGWISVNIIDDDCPFCNHTPEVQQDESRKLTIDRFNSHRAVGDFAKWHGIGRHLDSESRYANGVNSR